MLSEFTVLDLSLQLPGPYATMLLRGLGARIIKIEPPAGDPARSIDPAMFQRINAGKELLVLDLKQPAGQEVLYRLAQRSDAFVEGFRPGVVKRLAVDYPSLAAHAPRLVYCSLSGFGQQGPYAQVPAHDLNYLGLAGGLDAANRTAETGIGTPTVDLAAGTTAALLMVAALHEASKTGRGRYLDVSLFDAAVVWSQVKRPAPGHDGIGPEPTYGVFQTAGGSTVAVGILEDTFWPRLCAALDWRDWEIDPSLAGYPARRRRGEEIAQRLGATLLSRTATEWLDLARRHDLPVTPVRRLDEVPADPQVANRGLFEGGALQPPFPADTRTTLYGTVREPGSDRDKLLASFGWSPDEIAATTAAGAFGG